MRGWTTNTYGLVPIALMGATSLTGSRPLGPRLRRPPRGDSRPRIVAQTRRRWRARPALPLVRFARAPSCSTALPMSGPIARIDAVEHAQIGRPVCGAAAAVVFFVLLHRLLADFGRDLDERAAGCFHGQLDFSGLQEMLHQDESLARGLAHREHAVIVHDHGAIVAEMGEEPLALPEIFGDAFVGVIADGAEEAHRLLRDHAQPALEARDRHAGARVHVHRTIHVCPPAQDATVQREARAIDAGALVEVLVHADLDEVRSRDLRP